MKKLTLIFTAAILTVLAMQGCEKQQVTGPVDEVTPKILTRKTTVYPYNGGDTLLFTGASATDSLKWTVSPDENNYIRQKGNVSIIIFSKVGTYTVTAQKVSGGASASITMTVISSVKPVTSEAATTATNVVTGSSDTLDYQPITGDVRMALTYFINVEKDSALVNFNAITVNDFCSRVKVQFSSVVDNNRNYSLNLINLRGPKNCAGSTAPNMPAASGYVFVTKLMGQGTHPLKITLNGVTYNGSFTLANGIVTIDWPYTSGILIEPKVLKRPD